MMFMLLWWKRVTQIQRRQLTSTQKVWSLSWEDPTSWNHLETCSFLCLALESDSLEDWNYHVVHLHVSSLWDTCPTAWQLCTQRVPSRQTIVRASIPEGGSFIAFDDLVWEDICCLFFLWIHKSAKISINRKVNTTYHRKNFKEFAEVNLSHSSHSHQ